ncbi:MAG: helix-turn-helix domain-containing protein [Oscillospiraceae bacterium]|nr:helix-turn-helix domain-containing protein [Oscillospiraceae bacterium]
MEHGLFTIADKIKALREQLGMTQADLAKKLGLTRSGVNGWEMGLSVPSTPLLVEISKTFYVSTDYLLGLEQGATLKIDNLSDKEVAVLADIIHCFRMNRG